MIALIPARSGSKRIPNKNIIDFFNKPLMAYTVRLAVDSGLFSEVIVSSDAKEYLDIARKYGAETIERPLEAALDGSPDQDWIDHVFTKIPCEDYAILRPTNPFRTLAYLERGLALFYDNPDIEQIRAVELVSQHPYKMWQMADSGEIFPYYVKEKKYLEQSSTFPEIYVQNGSLEIRRIEPKSSKILPIMARGYEGFDINTIEDLLLASALVRNHLVKL